MLPKTHLWTSFLLMLIIWPFFGFWSLWVFLGGVFVDVDHYIKYISKENSWNLNNAYYFFKEKIDNDLIKEVYIFHTLETLIVLVFLSFYHFSFFIILSGWILHMILDIIHDSNSGKIRFGKRIIFSDLIILKLFKKR